MKLLDSSSEIHFHQLSQIYQFPVPDTPSLLEKLHIHVPKTKENESHHHSSNRLGIYGLHMSNKFHLLGFLLWYLWLKIIFWIPHQITQKSPSPTQQAFLYLSQFLNLRAMSKKQNLISTILHFIKNLREQLKGMTS